MSKSNLRIDILGTSFNIIIADEDSSYSESLLSRYRTNIEKTQKKYSLSDPLKVAILTGFLLCDEIQKLQTKGETSDSKKAEELTFDLIAKIDKILDQLHQ